MLKISNVIEITLPFDSVIFNSHIPSMKMNEIMHPESIIYAFQS